MLLLYHACNEVRMSIYAALLYLVACPFVLVAIEADVKSLQVSCVCKSMIQR